MFKRYFEDLQKDLLKKVSMETGTTKKSGAKKPAKVPSAGRATAKKKDTGPGHGPLRETIEKMVRPDLNVDMCRIIDSSGYAPEGIDLVLYRPLYRDMASLMGGHIPFELVHGTIHVCPRVNGKSAVDALSRVIQAKKINRFSENQDDYPIIPSFVVGYQSDMSLPEFKKYILDFYTTKGVEHAFEFDIWVILGKGLVIKNWREKRSFVAIESGKDTLMWFFVLMNEYMEMERKNMLDLRDYVQSPKPYSEY